MAQSWLQVLSVTVQESWIKLLRIQSEGDMVQYGECESLRSVLLQLPGCEDKERIDSMEMISTE
jgi:hypothetical protein